MLTEDTLLGHNKKVEASNISLQLLQKFYKKYLCDRLFVFELENDDEVILVFKEENMCHLLGIQHVMTGQHRAKDYAGSTGYQLIEDGTVTCSFLESKNKSGYRGIRNRLAYFHFVVSMLQSPELIEFTKDGLTTRMNFDLLMYQQHIQETRTVYLHLGLEKDKKSNVYRPVSFYEDKSDRYVVGRTKWKVMKVRVESSYLGVPSS